MMKNQNSEFSKNSEFWLGAREIFMFESFYSGLNRADYITK